MAEEKTLLNKLGEAVEAAKEKVQEVGASIAEKAGAVANEAEATSML